jgi:hypothetical protein
MRLEQTPGEVLAIKALANYLSDRGTRPAYAIDIKDSPDALFYVDGVVVAIECRYVASPELMQFKGRRNLEADVAYEVVIPYEPHLWVKNAVEEKDKNIEKYVSNTAADEAWLLLHSSQYHRLLSANFSDGGPLLC